jgi:hypothetical protein
MSTDEVIALVVIATTIIVHCTIAIIVWVNVARINKIK